MTRQLRMLFVALVVGACGGNAPGKDGAEELAPTSEQELLTLETASLDGAWQNSLPENSTDIQAVETVNFQLCAFTVGTALQIPPFPPIYLVWLRREPMSSLCSFGYVVLGSSYASPFVDIVRHPLLPLMAVSFSSKLTPSGSAHSQLRIVQPSYVSGEILRQSTLAAMSPDPFTPWLGNVYTGELSARADGTLIVSGQKDGLLSPSETPPGALTYTAIYRKFFFSSSTQPTPDQIITP